MNKIKSFLIGLILLIIMFIVIVLAALVYRANDQSVIKSYIFQINNSSLLRVGELQNINDISPENLRNKLIKKYVSEYFKVIPGDTNVQGRKTLRDLSSQSVFKKWQESEAQNIESMSAQNMFRIVRVYDDGIVTINKSDDYNYTDTTALPVYYSVRYYLYTWDKPNKIGDKPHFEQGNINIEARFAPGLRPQINGKSVNVRQYLEQGNNPVGLLKFQVTGIEDKDINR